MLIAVARVCVSLTFLLRRHSVYAAIPWQVRKELEAAEQAATAAKGHYAALKQAVADAEGTAAAAAAKAEAAASKVRVASEAVSSSDEQATKCRRAIMSAQAPAAACKKGRRDGDAGIRTIEGSLLSRSTA